MYRIHAEQSTYPSLNISKIQNGTQIKGNSDELIAWMPFDE